MPADPYTTLGVAAAASDAEIRTAYRRLAMLHHPDHNGGSAESAVRFAEVQEAYAHIRLMRRRDDAAAHGLRPGAPSADVEARIAQMEQELAAARALREQAARRAERAQRLRRAATGHRPGAHDEPRRPSDEELGYVSTNDSFTKILDDFADHVAGQVSDARHAPRPEPRRTKPRSVSDWIDELGSRLTGEDDRGR